MRVCVCVTCPQASVDIVSVGIASVGTVPLAHQQWADLGRPLLPGAALQACTCRAHAGGGASAWLCNVPPDSKDTDVCSTQDTLAPILLPPERALSIKVLPKQEKF